MTRRGEYLRLRRELLVSLAEAQRTELGYVVGRLSGPLRLIDTGLAIGRAVNLYRTLALAGAALLSRRRRGALFWLTAALSLWRTAKRRRNSEG